MNIIGVPGSSRHKEGYFSHMIEIVGAPSFLIGQNLTANIFDYQNRFESVCFLLDWRT